MHRVRRATMLLLCALGLPGCGEPSLDSPEYGEIIHQVPAHLNREYPLPELDPPATTPAPAPQPAAESPTAGSGDHK